MEMVSGGYDGGNSGLLHVNGGPGISMMPDGSFFTPDRMPTSVYEMAGHGSLDAMDMALQGYEFVIPLGDPTESSNPFLPAQLLGSGDAVWADMWNNYQENKDKKKEDSENE